MSGGTPITDPVELAWCDFALHREERRMPVETRDQGISIASFKAGAAWERAACAELARAAGCRCTELKDAAWGLDDGKDCAFCGQPKAAHGPEAPSPLGGRGGLLCPIPGVTSQFYTPSGSPVVLAHSPACPAAILAAIEARGRA